MMVEVAAEAESVGKGNQDIENKFQFRRPGAKDPGIRGRARSGGGKKEVQ
jgi:hypothetical protein